LSDLAVSGGRPVRGEDAFRWPVDGPEERQQLLDVLESGIWGYNGPKEREFERMFSARCGAESAVCVANGTVGLELALRALDIGPGDDVLVPAFTWTAAPWAIVQVGATPVFVDVRRDDWCIEPLLMRRAVTARSRAVIVVHTYDQVAEMDEISRVARETGLRVIEDCAHAHGSRWRERSVGVLGDAGSFSFQQGKSMTAGEGGIVITRHRDLGDRLRALRNCGRAPSPQSAHAFSGNYRLTEFQAAILLAQLGRLEDQIDERSANVARFVELLAPIEGVRPLPRKQAVTRRGMFALPLEIDRECFGGVSPALLVNALSAEGVPVRRPHMPVYRSPLWLAGLESRRLEGVVDRRRALGLDAHCPVADAIFDDFGLAIRHEAFLGAREVEAVATALRKVQRHGDALRELEKSGNAPLETPL
jgi:L-glutamine:2-deoxy-scyllo-inosose/3-amino-2,3-dideoxy-scyllo-inosose aminotransferase